MTKIRKVLRQEQNVKKELSLCDGVLSSNRVKTSFWLVKLPPTLSTKWSSMPPSSYLGKFCVSSEVDSNGKNIVKVQDHEGEEFKMLPVTAPHLHVMEKNGKQIDIAGNVDSMFQMSPINLNMAHSRARAITKVSNTVLRKTKMISIQGAESKQRLDVLVRNQLSKTAEEKRAEKLIKEREKAVKSDREVVMKKILEMFEQRRYISFNDLRDETNQPEDYLRGILKEVAVYINSGEHRMKWTLKENYQSHGEGEEQEEWQ